MRIGLIGLGKMGMNMMKRLIGGRHEVVAFARTPETVHGAGKSGALEASSLDDLISKLPSPKIIWLMIPSGKAVDDTLEHLKAKLKPGDIVIDGGNSFYRDSIRRHEMLKASKIHYLDVGTSGGIWGLAEGYCLMIGGESEPCKKLEPVFQTLAPKDGYLHAGPAGAGHYVKMIHNGIEYGMLQAYAEGFAIMKASGYDLNFEKVSHLWNRGSVVRSWLLEMAELAFKKDPALKSLKPYVEDSGEGRWTVAEAIEKNIPAPVITLSLLARIQSRDPESFGAKLIAAMRNEFGGHAVKKA